MILSTIDMTIECYNKGCAKHSCNSGDPTDEGPFCYEPECRWEPLVPAGYTAEELERDNPYNQWMHES